MKRWLGGVVVCCVVVFVVSGVVIAQPPSPAFYILHQQGAIFNSNTGWTLSTPPYYPGTDWAVDFLYGPWGVSILHQDGAVWSENHGWDYSGYYYGTGYARALDFLPDCSGCWCAFSGVWEFWETGPGTIGGEHTMNGYPYHYFEVTQTGRTITANRCFWDFDTTSWDCGTVAGSVVGDHIVMHTGAPPTTDGCSWGVELIGRVFWNWDRGSFQIQFAAVDTDIYCDGMAAGTEEGGVGIIDLFPTYSPDGGITWLPCECPPE